MTTDQNEGTDKPDATADIAFVKALAEVLKDNDLGELKVERGEGASALSVKITKSVPPVIAAPAAAPVAMAAAPVAAPAAPTAGAPAQAASDDPVDLPGVVQSQIVGTAYLSPEPDAPAFVSIGDKVTEGQTLLIVEAMKTMNQIQAPHSGTVKRILVEDKAAVEYGTPLMVVE